MFLRLHKGVSSPLCHRWESKQQPGVDLDTGVHLKKKKKQQGDQSFYPHPPQCYLCSWGVDFTVRQRGQAESCLAPAVHSYPSQLFLAKGPGHPPASSLLTADIQDPPSSRDHHHLLSGPSSFWDHFLLWEPLFFKASSAFQNPKASALPT